MLAFHEHKLRQPAVVFGHETATRMVLVAADYLMKVPCP
jgi:hypothetical protein